MQTCKGASIKKGSRFGEKRHEHMKDTQADANIALANVSPVVSTNEDVAQIALVI
jgi:hypothetical protein